MQDNLDKALEIINETEKILSRLAEYSTNFFNSMKPALHHITITTKGYIFTKIHLNNSKVFINLLFVYIELVVIVGVQFARAE